MDSSSVISSAVKGTGVKQTAFSSVYEDKTYDESEDIHTILDSAVSQWHRVEVSNPDVFGLIEKMVAVNDEPVATATWLSHYIVCEEAAKNGITHLFGGLGGDELNAGEYEHFFPFFADLKIAGQQQLLESEVGKWVEYHNHPIYRKSYAVMEEMVGKVCDQSQIGVCRPDRERLERYRDLLNPDYFDLSSFQPVMDHPFDSYLKNRCFQDIFRETSPCCLRAQDRQGMAFGIQHVMPFFDYRLVEFMFRVAGTMKFRDGVTKSLLRKAMSGILPDSTRQRIKKTGWNAPAHLWFSGSGQEPLLDLVHSQSFRERGIYNVDEVIRVIQEHGNIVSSDIDKENHMMFLWQIVNLDRWMSTIGRID
jgi:asparagine synthase (glutamine-hydrolysing)